MNDAWRGSEHTAATKRKMRRTHKRLGTRPPAAGPAWSEQEDELLRTLPTAEVVQRTGRTLNAVRCRRRVLGLPDGRKTLGPAARVVK